ncbi:hypothetical protein PQR68_34515 [Paraburkholderia agricolaris]|uniref:hypothetical protein n=1 Tax=Paraburkholderia agricolaris TaxID=2152888 RepID=UPI0038B9A564
MEKETQQKNLAEARNFNVLIEGKIGAGEINARDIADAIGATVSYVGHLRNGTRAWAGLGRDKLKQLAVLLGISPIAVFRATGYVKDEDWMIVKPGVFDTIYRAMRSDPLWFDKAPREEEWNALPGDVQLAIARLYEGARAISVECAILKWELVQAKTKLAECGHPLPPIEQQKVEAVERKRLIDRLYELDRKEFYEAVGLNMPQETEF